MKTIVERYPVLSYIALCYAISWGVWFAIPLVAPGPWTLIKLFVGIGMGPGVAAILLDRIRGTAGPVDRKWWSYFAAVAFAVLLLNVSSLLTGDGRTAADFKVSVAPGITSIGLFGAIAAAIVCGFIFASAAQSRSSTLHSIVRWRAPLRWWWIAAFLMAALLLVSFGIALATGEELPESVRAGLPWGAWLGFVVRSALFTLLVVGIGEETGWRGWMLPELLKRYTPLKSSILVGLVWGMWHLPLFIVGAYPGPADAVVEYLFIGPMLSILLTWMFNRTGGNLLLAIVFHMAINNSARVLPTTVMFPVFLTLLIVTVVIVERMWRRDFRPRVAVDSDTRTTFP